MTAVVPIVIGNVERDLRITNRIYSDIGEDPGYLMGPRFSDLSWEIADALAEYFKGYARVVRNFERREAYLNVESGTDTIQVAYCDLEPADC